MKEHAQMESSVKHATPPILLGVYLALIAFTLLSFGASRVSHTLALYVALSIAAIKSGLVAAYFMGLKYDPPFLRYILIFSVGLVLWFILLLRPDFYAR